jgi:hypothetical protein
MYAGAEKMSCGESEFIQLHTHMCVYTGAEKMSFEQHADAIQSFDWNYNGSLYGTYCKDKKIRLIDPVY